MDLNSGTDLAALHVAIADSLAAAFPGVHWEFYREDRKNLPLGDGVGDNPPKAYGLLNLAEMDASDEDPGTDQQAVTARFECELVVKGLRQDAKVGVRVLAGSVAAFLRSRSRWPGVVNGAMKVAGCYKDDFSPELDQFEVWRVEWVQDLVLGTGVWLHEGETPTQPLFSYVPLVGVPYEDEYQPADTGVPHV